MGCDIHLVLEKKHEGKWVAVDTFQSHHRAHPSKDDSMDGFSSPAARSRNYQRFSKLAGVRGDGPDPRGVPDDASETTKLMVADWGSDGHSHSWLPMTDAAKIFLETQWVAPGKEHSEYVSKWPESYYFGVDCSGGTNRNADDFRIVFWFDN